LVLNQTDFTATRVPGGPEAGQALAFRRPSVTQPLWTRETLQQPIPALPPFTSISDGTGNLNGVIGLCQLSSMEPHPTVARVDAGDTSYEAEFAGLIFSLEALLDANAPADQGEMLFDCQTALATFQRTRQPGFRPLSKPHGRCAILQLYLSALHPPSPMSGFRLIYIQAHSDEQDQGLISDEDMPLYQGHVQCDRAAVAAKEIVPASNVTFFDTDFDFAIFTEEDGRRLFRPFAGHIRDLGSSPDFHAKMTRTPRTDSVGHSWRDIKWRKLYLPRIHTAWNSKRAFRPDLRGSMDYQHALDRLKQMPQLHHAVLHGSDKVLTPHRLRTLGGLARITEQPKCKNQCSCLCRVTV
jgi:hypothetical protein